MRRTQLCFCRDCTFAFYSYRFSETEANLLYRNYRDREYQREREKYECWYTVKVNDAINHGGVREQQRVITKILSEHGMTAFDSALDYGGNRGETLTAQMGTREKYVYDISGVEPVDGIRKIDSFEELLLHRYDLILCNSVFEHLSDPADVMEKLRRLGGGETIYYMEVPSENPFLKGYKFSVQKNLELLLNPNYNWVRLAKYYFQMKKQPFMPMKEHINFFTPQSIRILAERHGFEAIDVQENVVKSPLGRAVSLSMLFHLRS